jgi:hypothetical protein
MYRWGEDEESRKQATEGEENGIKGMQIKHYPKQGVLDADIRNPGIFQSYNYVLFHGGVGLDLSLST